MEGFSLSIPQEKQEEPSSFTFTVHEDRVSTGQVKSGKTSDVILGARAIR